MNTDLWPSEGRIRSFLLVVGVYFSIFNSGLSSVARQSVSIF